jgi:hypothetical protein
LKNSRSYDKKDDCKRGYFKKKSNEAMHNDQYSKLSTINSSGKEVGLVQYLLCALDLGLALAQAAGATTTIMSTKMTAGRIHPSSAGTCTPPRETTADAFIALKKAMLSLPPSLL